MTPEFKFAKDFIEISKPNLVGVFDLAFAQLLDKSIDVHFFSEYTRIKDLSDVLFASDTVYSVGVGFSLIQNIPEDEIYDFLELLSKKFRYFIFTLQISVPEKPKSWWQSLISNDFTTLYSKELIHTPELIVQGFIAKSDFHSFKGYE